MRRKIRNNGYLFTELLVSIIVLGTILACLAMTMKTFRTFNLYQLTRQKCIAAAQAQLDSIAATGETINEDDFNRLWPRTTVQISKTNGSGQWEGLVLVRAKATAKAGRKDVSVELARYFEKQEK